MGYYINPEDQSKEAFLKQHGTPISADHAASFDFTTNQLPVCLVDNIAFTAAGIAYDTKERDAFLRPDRRLKRWFLVDKEALKPYYSE
jgi:hypothetical protein